jgi:hypothetical protein
MRDQRAGYTRADHRDIAVEITRDHCACGPLAAAFATRRLAPRRATALAACKCRSNSTPP